ncbi:carboxylesterase/lipase family protein [Aquisediminimonas profunda]|uniref:carboxylesterase/lipase family protein n=1 Tax=Aquisediminimonas profunda TaxID=1550733 RepID=UPI001FE6C66B|nr:carboxylesterase family protein [Aquisediminimonas profunda]
MLALALLAAAPATAKPLVRTDSGLLAGKVESGVESFLGVPYAAPPIGPLRWRAPQPAANWVGSRDATRFGAACYQDVAKGWGPYSAEFIATAPISEDCLFLNVWKPAGARKHLPVVVFIHGGAFAGGSGHVPIYDGAKLARRGLVVVTINYRVGVFGFLAHPGLTAEGDGSGNFGLLDQVAALRWVKSNVARLGGDPARVTIAGESAGAASVNDLQVMPAAKGLFTRAISISGASMSIDAPTLAAGELDGAALADRVNARTPAELRAVSAQTLVELTRVIPGSGPPRLTYVPHVDGKVLPFDSANPAAVRATRAPLLTGFNADEMIDPSVCTPADLERSLRARYGAFAEVLLPLYPHANDAEAVASNSLIARDRYMAGLLNWASARPRSKRDPIYLYRHDWPYPPVRGAQAWGAFHSSSLPYVFGTIGLGERDFGAADRILSAHWQDSIRAFAATGNPARPKHPWPAVRAGTTQVMALGRTQGLRPAVSTPERLAAWRRYAASGGHLGLM